MPILTMIHLTTTAVQEIQRLKQSRGQSQHYFRLGVKSGGCAGWFYTLELTPDYSDHDLEYQSQGIPILIPEAYIALIKDLQIDYAEDLMGGGFRFSNPNAQKTCSCSLSFQV